MTTKEKTKVKYVQLNTALLIGLIGLIIGFLGGLFYSVYGPGSENQTKPAVFSPGTSGQPNITSQQTRKILELEKETESNPENAITWLQLGNLYFDTDNPQRAIDAYKKYIGIIPDNPNVWTDLGVMYRRNGQPKEAIAAFSKAIEIDPRHQQSRFNKGVVFLHDLNDPIAAKKEWEELAKLNPNFIAPGGRPLTEMIGSLKFP